MMSSKSILSTHKQRPGKGGRRARPFSSSFSSLSSLALPPRSCYIASPRVLTPVHHKMLLFYSAILPRSCLSGGVGAGAHFCFASYNILKLLTSPILPVNGFQCFLLCFASLAFLKIGVCIFLFAKRHRQPQKNIFFLKQKQGRSRLAAHPS